MKPNKIKFIEKGRLDNNEMLLTTGGNCGVAMYITCGGGYRWKPECMAGYTTCDLCYYGCSDSSYQICDAGYSGKP